MANPNTPHEAIVWCEYEIHSVRPDGEFSGDVAERNKFLVSIRGDTLPDVQSKLKEWRRGQSATT